MRLAVPAGRARAAPAVRPGRCSTRGSRRARRSTAARTRSRTTSAPPSTSSRWCSATRATRRAPASASRATRRRASGALFGEFLVNAQGEDVVAGHPHARADRADARDRSRRPTTSSSRRSSGSRSTTARCRTSSSRSRTGALYLLQTRTGKRTAQAALRIAVEMTERGPDLARGGGRADRSRPARPAAPPDDRPDGRGRGRRDGPQRVARAPPPGRSCSTPISPRSAGGRARTSSSSAGRRRPTTSTA